MSDQPSVSHNTDDEIRDLQNQIDVEDASMKKIKSESLRLEKNIEALYILASQSISEEDRQQLESNRQGLRDLQQKYRNMQHRKNDLENTLRELKTKSNKRELNTLISKRDHIKNILIPDTKNTIERLTDEAKNLDRQIVDIAAQLTNLQK